MASGVSGRTPDAAPAIDDLRRLHSEAGHERPLFIGGRWFGTVPELVQAGEVGVHRRSVHHEEASFGIRSVAERVGSTARHEDEPLRTDGQLLILDGHRHRTVEDEVGLRAVGVPMWWRSATAGGEYALHEGQVAVIELRRRLEIHHAASSGETLATLTRPKDDGSHGETPAFTPRRTGSRADRLVAPAPSVPRSCSCGRWAAGDHRRRSARGVS